MIKHCFRLLASSLLLGACVAIPAFAADAPYVYDEAGLFTESEAEEIAQKITDLTDRSGMACAVVTTDDAEGKSSQEYADDYYDDLGIGPDPDYSGMLYLIDMDNRELTVSTSGDMIRYLTDERIDDILDAAYEYAAKGDYAGSALAALDTTETFIQAGIEDGQYNYASETGQIDPYQKKKSFPVIALIFGMIAGLATALITFFSVKGKYQLTGNTYHYPLADKSTLDLTVSEDRLVNQFITHRRIPKNPPPSGSSRGSGRSTTRVSSSGRTHGGGSRKF